MKHQIMWFHAGKSLPHPFTLFQSANTRNYRGTMLAVRGNSLGARGQYIFSCRIYRHWFTWYHGSDIASLGGTVHETETVLLAADKIQTVHGTMILAAPLFFFRIHTRLT